MFKKSHIEAKTTVIAEAAIEASLTADNEE